jgi:sugar phosphate permease
MLGSKLPAGVVLAGGLVGIAATSALKAQCHSPATYAALQVLHAVFQSAGWPTCIKVLATWVTHNRGTVMGLWVVWRGRGG